MKLASLKHGRDGRLVVVSRDLTQATDAFFIAPTLQAALDEWERIAPRLADLAESLEHGIVPAFRFHEHNCASPLPRAYQWADGSAYSNHTDIMRRARGNTLKDSDFKDPSMYQGGSDSFLGPRDSIRHASEAYGIDLEGEVSVIVRDVPMGASIEECRAAIVLVLLANDVSLRNVITEELPKSFGFFHGKPSTAFSPVAVTPDELGDAWDGGKLTLPMLVYVNSKPLGKPNAGQGLMFDFPALIAHAAKTRPLVAGTIIGGGTISNGDADGDVGRPISEGGVGYACLAELRTVEKLRTGAPKTDFLKFGDTIRIEMKDRKGHSIFGAIEQTVEQYVK